MTTWTIRPARPEDGPAIGKLFLETEAGDTAMHDWSDPQIADWWLVAEQADGALVGAIQVMASRPAGYIGEIVVHPAERARNVDGRGAMAPTGGALARLLYFSAEAALRRAGVQGVCATISTSRRGWRRILGRWGFSEHTAGHVLIRKELSA